MHHNGRAFFPFASNPLLITAMAIAVLYPSLAVSQDEVPHHPRFLKGLLTRTFVDPFRAPGIGMVRHLMKIWSHTGDLVTHAVKANAPDSLDLGTHFRGGTLYYDRALSIRAAIKKARGPVFSLAGTPRDIGLVAALGTLGYCAFGTIDTLLDVGTEVARSWAGAETARPLIELAKTAGWSLATLLSAGTASGLWQSLAEDAYGRMLRVDQTIADTRRILEEINPERQGEQAAYYRWTQGQITRWLQAMPEAPAPVATYLTGRAAEHIAPPQPVPLDVSFQMRRTFAGLRRTPERGWRAYEYLTAVGPTIPGTALKRLGTGHGDKKSTIRSWLAERPIDEPIALLQEAMALHTVPDDAALLAVFKAQSLSQLRQNFSEETKTLAQWAGADLEIMREALAFSLLQSGEVTLDRAARLADLEAGRALVTGGALVAALGLTLTGHDPWHLVAALVGCSAFLGTEYFLRAPRRETAEYLRLDRKLIERIVRDVENPTAHQLQLVSVLQPTHQEQYDWHSAANWYNAFER